MKSLILFLALSLCIFAGDKKKDISAPAVPVLTDAQKASIALALYDSAALNGAREAIAKSEDNLRKALQACGSGFLVTRDPADQQLKCIAALPPSSVGQASAAPPPAPPATK